MYTALWDELVILYYIGPRRHQVSTIYYVKALHNWCREHIRECQYTPDAQTGNKRNTLKMERQKISTSAINNVYNQWKL